MTYDELRAILLSWPGATRLTAEISPGFFRSSRNCGRIAVLS